jgi:[CysO sulfur-carrier protein]-S-L-cysteine hydrolase
VIVTEEELRTMVAQAIEEYPSECCGVVMGRAQERRLLRFRNAQDEYHAKDPGSHPRTSETAYYVGAEDRSKMTDLESQGFALLVIYHSHINAGAYFSETDKRNAMMGAEPTWPDTTYVVVSVRDRRVDAIAGFRWDPELRDFGPVDLGVDAAILTEGRS